MLRKDLPDLFNKIGQHIFLNCSICGGEYSAHKGDYFLLANDQEMMCCNEPMELVRKTEVIEQI